jgi:hypothetical protein
MKRVLDFQCVIDRRVKYAGHRCLIYSAKETKNMCAKMQNFRAPSWGIFENDDAPQKTNKDRTNTLLPPSFRQV